METSADAANIRPPFTIENADGATWDEQDGERGERAPVKADEFDGLPVGIVGKCLGRTGCLLRIYNTPVRILFGPSGHSVHERARDRTAARPAT